MNRLTYTMSYALDPRWIDVKRRCICEKCGAAISRGDRAFYYPSTKSMLCAKDDCGGQESRDFEAAAFDEAMYNGSF